MASELIGSVLIERAKASRLPLARVAREAGLNKHTLSNMGKDRNVLQSTLIKVRRVIESRERSELMRLYELHREWFDNPERSVAA